VGELHARAPRYAALGRLVSIYFGGGTPSLWRPECIDRLVTAIRAQFSGAPSLEVTIEANPTDCSEERVAAWRTAGITRVSIGVQSFRSDELVVLGRDHRFGDGRAAIACAARLGMQVSADFILGTPVATTIGAQAGAATPLTRPQIPDIVDLAIDHLSVYELTIEERTAFGARARAGRLPLHDEDTLYELYVATHSALVAKGWEHYEISSYARPGRRAVHNSLYWSGAAFLGLGVGAASLFVAPDGGGERTTNPRRAHAYFAAPGQPVERTVLSERELATDRAWLGMRTCDGVDEAVLPPALATALVGDGLADRRDGRICPTLRGFVLADRIAAQIVAAL
jgi:oxygen-independent coproporphyrinogen-3 oxidase